MDPKNLEALILLGRVSQMPHELPDGKTGVSCASLERAELNLQAATTLARKVLEALAATDAAAKRMLGEPDATAKPPGS